jgi:hypothetical protein
LLDQEWRVVERRWSSLGGISWLVGRHWREEFSGLRSNRKLRRHTSLHQPCKVRAYCARWTQNRTSSRHAATHRPRLTALHRLLTFHSHLDFYSLPHLVSTSLPLLSRLAQDSSADTAGVRHLELGSPISPSVCAPSLGRRLVWTWTTYTVDSFDCSLSVPSAHSHFPF